jgi:DnaJ-class molecular chaperone
VRASDRHASADAAEKKKAEAMFKDIGEAYEVLSDSEKRRR